MPEKSSGINRKEASAIDPILEQGYFYDMGITEIKASIRALPLKKRHALIRSVLDSEANREAHAVRKWLQSLTPKFSKNVLDAMEKAHACAEKEYAAPRAS